MGRSVLLTFCVLGSIAVWLGIWILQGGDRPCYAKPGIAGLAIQFQVAHRTCPNTFPWVANVMNALVQTHGCSGVLIKEDLVVVPAQCIFKDHRGADAFPLVRLGSYDLNFHDGLAPEEVLTTCKQIIHSNYTGDPRKGYDIALLQLNTTAEHHTPVSGFISARECQSSSDRVSALGWFSSGRSGSPSHNLQAVRRLTFVNNDECSKVLDGIPEAGVVCTITNPKSVAEWDLGSPLLCKDQQLIGLSSFALHAQVHTPKVYTHVFEFKEWIETMGEGASTQEENVGNEFCKHQTTMDLSFCYD